MEFHGDANELAPIQFSQVKISEDFYKKVGAWDDLEQVGRAFRLIRDARFIEFNSEKHRLNWLEPNDRMCMQRAGLAAGILLHSGFPMATSVLFSGGFISCSAWRDGDAGGQKRDGSACISWPWHNALGVRVGDEVYILDPALNFERPVTLREWVELSFLRDSGQGLKLEVGMKSLGDHFVLGEHYGYDLADKKPKDVFDVFIGAYKQDATGHHPIESEFMKVQSHHSKKLMYQNPPWVGRTFDEKSKWWRFGVELQRLVNVASDCTEKEEGFLVRVDVRGPDWAHLSRIDLEPEILKKLSTVATVLLDSDNEVIQYNLSLTASESGVTNGVLGARAKIGFAVPREVAHNCEIAIQMAKGLVKAIEVQ